MKLPRFKKNKNPLHTLLHITRINQPRKRISQMKVLVLNFKFEGRKKRKMNGYDKRFKNDKKTVLLRIGVGDTVRGHRCRKLGILGTRDSTRAYTSGHACTNVRSRITSRVAGIRRR